MPPSWSRLAVVAALLLASMASVRAWDTNRMNAAARREGTRAVASVALLQPLLRQAAEMDDRTRIHAVNQFYNRRIAFRDDVDAWGQVDYWASPLEAMQKGEGDCEDYAIAKYFSLLAAGTPMQRLRMVYVRAQLGPPGSPTQAHMVLAYHETPESDPLILDNLVDDVRPASRRPDLTPVFSFNGEGLWEGVGGRRAGEPVSRLSRWREVLIKAREEGFL
jgi:predicted transglutaminase-like cysteine proteinase